VQNSRIQFDDRLGFQNEVLGVLDIDDTGLEAFGDEDRVGLEAVVEVLVANCDWE
jgi:putative methionine-R-sulfoxide reductase with GAF domain